MALSHHLVSYLPCDIIPKRLIFPAPDMPHMCLKCVQMDAPTERSILSFIYEGQLIGNVKISARFLAPQISVKHLFLNKHRCEDANYSLGHY